MRRVAGVLWHPRSTMAEVVRTPAFIPTWIALLVVVGLCGGVLLATSVGRQALVDERVRVAEILGRGVDDSTYAAWQARPPYYVWATSGGRLLVTPLVTCLVAAGLVALARLDGAHLGYRVALAVTVHATSVLALQQVVAAPLGYVRESLGSPTTLSAVLPMVDEGTWAARVLGAMDLFGLWWLALLAIGAGAATGRPPRRYWWRLLVAYAAIAALVAMVFGLLGTEAA
jgi:hypothetical protein